MNRKKQAGLALVFGAAGALVVWSGSLLIPDRHTSRALLRLTAEPYPVDDAITVAYQDTVARQTLKTIIQRLNLYPEERERLPLEDVVERMKNEDVRLDIERDQEMRLAFTYADAAASQRGLDALLQAMLAANRELRERDPGWATLEVKNAAGPGQAMERAFFWHPTRYVSRGVLTVKHEPFAIDEAAVERRFQVLQQTVLDPAHLEILIYRFGLYPWLHDRGQFVETRVEMVRHLQIENKRGLVTVAFTDSDAVRAQRVAAAVVTMLSDADIHLGCRRPEDPPLTGASKEEAMQPDYNFFRRVARETPARRGVTVAAAANGGCINTRPAWERLDVLDPASLPQESDGPVRGVLAAYGFLLGVGLWTALRPS